MMRADMRAQLNVEDLAEHVTVEQAVEIICALDCISITAERVLDSIDARSACAIMATPDGRDSGPHPQVNTPISGSVSHYTSVHSLGEMIDWLNQNYQQGRSWHVDGYQVVWDGNNLVVRTSGGEWVGAYSPDELGWLRLWAEGLQARGIRVCSKGAALFEVNGACLTVPHDKIEDIATTVFSN